MNRIRMFFRDLWRVAPALTGVGAFLLGVLGLTAIGLVADSRLVTGVPVWLKPAKFAASTAIYSFTLAWMFRFLPDWPRTRRIVGGLTAVVFVVEIAIIALQAARGTTSHFNTATLIDGVLFSVMGAGILAQTIASVFVASALWRQKFADPTLGWALRLGMTLTILGALTGGLMTRPTSEQLASVRATGQMPVSGAHTVGGPDGGPGLPGVGWSREHGDLRVAHFIGLHAVQALAIVGVVLPGAWSVRRRARTVALLAASYASLFAIVLWQGLSGESVVAPGPDVIVAFGMWGALTLLGVVEVGAAESKAWLQPASFRIFASVCRARPTGRFET